LTAPNPVNWYFRVYSPGGSDGNRYCPFSFVTDVWFPISAGLVAVTVTPGRIAPVLSVTVPVMLPVVCAHAGTATSNIRTMDTPYLLMSLLLLVPNEPSAAGHVSEGGWCLSRNRASYSGYEYR
jgi:hypothetical protein